MRYVEINEKEYEVPDLDFNAMCELEDRGIPIAQLRSGDAKELKLASMVRGIAAWIMDCSLRQSGIEINEHLKKGGNLDGILDAFNDEGEKAGFSEEGKVKQIPRDHKKKNKKNASKKKINYQQQPPEKTKPLQN